MQDFFNSIASVIEQLNPSNTGNLILYFSWIVIYTLTWMTIWLSRTPWLRLASFVVNQVFSVGIVISSALTAVLAYAYWKSSLVVFIATAVIGFFMFRRRR